MANAEGIHPVVRDVAPFERMLKERQGATLLLLLTIPDCPACRQVDGMLVDLSLPPDVDVRILELDPEDQAHIRFMIRLNITECPTLLLFDAGHLRGGWAGAPGDDANRSAMRLSIRTSIDDARSTRTSSVAA